MNLNLNSKETQFSVTLNLPLVTISPNDYPNFNSELGVNNYRPHPGDLSRFLAFKGQTYLGANYHERYNNPMLAAPNGEGIAGTIYFQNDVSRDDFFGALRLLEIKDPPGAPKEFVVYSASSQKPGEEQYLRQLRIVSHFAMRHEFHAVKDDQKSKLPTQELSLEEVLWLFIQNQREEWGVSFGSPKLEGLFGGDGWGAREELSFGLQVESDYNGVYRIWSRAWLVHK